VDDSYDGPKMEDEITLEFVKAMIERFKNQKTIHKKFAFSVKFFLFFSLIN